MVVPVPPGLVCGGAAVGKTAAGSVDCELTGGAGVKLIGANV